MLNVIMKNTSDDYNSNDTSDESSGRMKTGGKRTSARMKEIPAAPACSFIYYPAL